jgi:hypothetical protein
LIEYSANGRSVSEPIATIYRFDMPAVDKCRQYCLVDLRVRQLPCTLVSIEGKKLAERRCQLRTRFDQGREIGFLCHELLPALIRSADSGLEFVVWS